MIRKQSKRTTILDAAARIIHNKGILNLTLDAVAEEAGVSKGGLLYHFPSKEILVSGMVQHLIQQYVHRIQDSASKDEHQKGKWTRAFIQETFYQVQTNKDMEASLLAAVAVNPGLLEPIQKAYYGWQEQIENDGLDPVDATILRLAIDGLWFSALFNLAPLDNSFKEQILDALIKRTK